MRFIILSAVALLSTFVLFSCKKDNPIPPEGQPQVTLSLEDTSCTEVWIKLSTNNVSLPTDVELYKDSSLTETISLSNTDSLLYVDSLLPNQSYSFHSVIHSINQSSNSLAVTTMDTTSHNFTWQTWTFGGQAGSCDFWDVAIIDENNIWAVGEIYLLDSLGQPDPQAYGIAKWNGQTWKPKKIFYNNNIPVTPKGIWVAGPNDIYLASGSVFHWDGTSSTVQLVYSRLNLADPNGTVEKLWGNSEMLYGVGNAGTIVTYQNGQWSIIESETDLNIGDIWGIKDDNGGYNKYLAADNYMLIINSGNNLQSINTESGHSLSSIWGKTIRLIYTAGGNGLSLYKNYKWERINQADVNTIYCIRGSDFNNVFGLSSTHSILHFNGYTWQYILPAANNIYYRLDVKSNVIAAVGWQDNKAVVTLIKRNN